MKDWKNESENYKLTQFTMQSSDENVVILKSKYLFEITRSTAEVQHLIYPDGRIQVGFVMDIHKLTPNVPRIGLQSEIDEGLQNIEWYGRGPRENYLDRKDGAALGTYRSTVDKWITPYVRPQENANRCDIRRIRFSNDDEGGIQFTSGKGGSFSASAWPYTQETLSDARHDFELKKHGRIVVNIDCAQMGVGGDNSWGLPVLEQYLLKPGIYTYSFIINGN